jgi:DNA ligase (NAD+)
MTKTEAKKRLEVLRAEIEDHRHNYHVLDKPKISDAAYDSLFHELVKIEEEFPELITKDSPSQRVGGEPLKKFEKVEHIQRMLSINDVFSEDELKKWEERLVKLGAKKAIESGGYYAELKMDGLAVALKYINGVLDIGSTRGDGRVGENVTQNLRTVKSIPLKLRKIDNIENVEVRGEVFLSKKDFEKLNQEREKQGLPKYANPRNIAAGSVRQLDPKVTADRDLDFFVYSVPSKFGLKYHHEEHDFAADLGFKTNGKNKCCKNIEEVIKYLNHWVRAREELPYQTDGVVVVLDDKKEFERLGAVGKASRGMIAYKFPAEEATSVMRDIIVQVGRTGKLTPVAVMDPTLVAGSTVTRATLHNEDEIKRKDIKIGDTVIIRKAGDVIPEVVEPIKKMRDGDEKHFSMPKKCPICRGEIEKRAGEVDYYCKDPKCAVREKRAIEFFVSKNASDIDGLGPKIVEKLLDEGLIATVPDIFELKVGDLEPLERFAEKSAQNIVEAVENSKKISLDRFIYALGIRHVGAETAVDVARHFGNLENFLHAREEDFGSIYGIGEKVTESIKKYISDEKNQKMIDKLLKLGVKISDYHSPVRKNILDGKSFVVTGTLGSMTRDDAHKKIVTFGGKISSSVTSKTDYLIEGEEPGSKLDKAKKFGTKILSENEFIKMIS